MLTVVFNRGSYGVTIDINDFLVLFQLASKNVLKV